MQLSTHAVGENGLTRVPGINGSPLSLEPGKQNGVHESPSLGTPISETSLKPILATRHEARSSRPEGSENPAYIFIARANADTTNDLAKRVQEMVPWC